MFKQQLEKLQSHKAVIGIIGLGYVGLPLVLEFCKAGFDVIGFDVDKRKVDKLLKKQSYIKHIPSEKLGGVVGKNFTPTTDFDRLGEPDAICICVPTPLTPARDPDLTYVHSTAKAIAKRLRRGQLIVLESTTYPGTTSDEVRPLLEAGGLSVAAGDFYLAYSPEREDPGRIDFSTGTIPKIVGGCNEESLALAKTLYDQVVKQTVPVRSCEVAEAAKILENIYRCVNIAMVNELKMLFDRLNIDIWEVIDAAKTKPFGFQAFYPGPGLGGHCIPIDPFYLSWKARQVDMSTRFIELAGEVNRGMPEWVINRLAGALNEARKPLNGSKVLVLGVAYKKDVDDFRESPAFRILELLQEHKAVVTYHDPFVPHLESEKGLSPIRMSGSPLTDESLAEADAVLIVTDHSNIDYQRVVDAARLVVDTRNATAACADPDGKIYRA